MDASTTALGKRKAADDEGETPVEPTGSSSSAPSLPSVEMTKVVRVDSPTLSTSSKTSAEGDGSSAAAAGAAAGGGDDDAKLREVLEKLKKLIGDDGKMPKALPVLMKAMDASVNPDNAAAFLEVIQLAVTAKRMDVQKLRNLFLELFVAMDKVKERFGPEHQFEVDTILLRRTHALLYTDDSFVLAKAAGIFQKVITGLPLMKESKSVQANPRLGQERRQAVLDALETLMTLANAQWAKSTVDVTMKLASEQRLQFPEPQREQMDDMTNKLKGIRNKGAFGGGEKARHLAFPSYSA